ncbi:hypothetical protein M9Y10_044898 [Tritrichomonas musculus]|uniref:Protein kinase domain-containing protein n=1 Tax=Tritrichomonas musculus TaxID=1915356 RepID=A0ABR2JU21_9EUKA
MSTNNDFENYKVNPDEFDINKSNKAGQGGYAVVYFGKQKRNGRKCAMKKFFENGNFRTMQNSFQKEVMILGQSIHPAILPFIGYSMDKHFCIYIEAMENGSLAKILKEKEIKLDITQKHIISFGISCGMEYLHSREVIHRDLKSDNILLDSNLHPYISDFGTSTETFSERRVSRTISSTTIAIMAPEFSKDPDIYNRTKPIDVYSFSMVMYYLWTEKPPFGDPPNILKVTDAIDGSRPEIPKDSIPKEWEKLIYECWSQNQNDRPTFSQICDRLESDDFLNLGVDRSKFKSYKELVRSPISKAINRYNEYIFSPLKPEEKSNHREITSYLDPSMMYLVSKCKKIGERIQINVEESLYLLKKAADLGDADAQYSYALHLYKLNTEQDEKLGLQYLEMSAKKGNGEAMFLYSQLHPDQPEASEFFLKSTNTGIVPEAWALNGSKLIKQGQIEEGLLSIRQAIQYGSMNAMLTYANYCKKEDFYEMASHCCHALDSVGFILPIEYIVYRCENCNIEICEGCAKHCHKDHRIKEIGPKRSFVCECGEKGFFYENENKIICNSQFLGEMKVNGQPCLYQHLYKCLDCCTRSQEKFICKGCAEKCHKDHRVIDCGAIKGFCSCGLNGIDNCQPCKLTHLPQTNHSECTITIGRNLFQRWFQCATCGICGDNKKGICQKCAETCHAGHTLFDRGVSFNECQCKQYGDVCKCKF